MLSLGSGYRAAVFGASGGVGAALVSRLAADPACAAVYAGARQTVEPVAPTVAPFRFDLLDEASLAASADLVCAAGPPELVIVATGLLHDGAMRPEKSLRALEAENLLQSFRINAIGPVLIAKHVLFRFPRDRRAIFAALSARVGSIGDNRSGGWVSYRASKAALNQMIRTASIELAARCPLAVCVGLHPGTVETRMSQPFRAGVPPAQLFPADTSAGHLLTVLDRLTPQSSGRTFAWDGREVPP
jgi:NAD(P)-dependent dehydrogenase (short-subunit alcohol dehydrogenase family)